MKKVLLSAIAILAIMNVSMPRAEAWIFRTKSPVSGQLESLSNDKFMQISELEMKVFGLSFEGEEVYTRVARLENRLFNGTQDGLDLNNRVDRLLSRGDAVALNGVSPQELAETEFKIFNRTYVNEKIENRLARLERKLLGAEQGGGADARFALIRTASQRYNPNTYTYTTPNYPQTVYTPNYYNTTLPNVFPTGTNSGWRNVLGNVLNGFMGGTMTGYTPPIYDPYGYGYNNNGFQYGGSGFNSNVVTPYGYRNVINNMSGGASVRILD